MATDIKIRGGHRSRATINIGKLKELIDQEVKDKHKVSSLIDILIENRNILKQFDERIQSSLSDDDFLKDLLESDEKQLEINEWIKKGQEIIINLENPVDESMNRFLNSSNLNKESTSIKLPVLKLPYFDGNPINWQQFWDIFRSSIHERSDIIGAQKFAYLKGQLQNEALQLIEGFSTTDNDYLEALELLKNTYGKPYKIIQAHLHAIFDITEPSCSSTELRKFRASYESHLRSLKALDVEVDQAGFVFVAYLLRKLPSKVRVNLNRAAKSDRWNLEGFRLALENEISLLQAVEPENPYRIKGTSKDNEKIKNKVSNSVKAKTTMGSYSVNINKSFCKFCFKNHPFWQCTKYDNTSARLERAKELNLFFLLV